MKLTIGHLYGNLLNTYGDNGNLLMLQHHAKKQGFEVETKLVSIGDEFNPDEYDIVMMGGGQDYEQKVVSKDIQTKKEAIHAYIEQGGVMLGICGGFQLLGHYYINAAGEKIEGISACDWYTLNQDHNRFIGDIEIHNEEFEETYYGYENHSGRTFLGEHVQPLGYVISGYGNNNEDKTEGAHYKNVFCSYFHGPLLVRNQELAERLVSIAAQNKQAKVR